MAGMWDSNSGYQSLDVAQTLALYQSQVSTGRDKGYPGILGNDQINGPASYSL